MQTPAKTFGLAGLLALVLLFASAQVMAQGRGRGRGWGRAGPASTDISVGLDLTAEQLDKIDASRMKFAKRALDLQAQLDLKRLEKQRLMLADEIDRKAIRAKDAEMEALRKQLRSARLEHRLDVLEVLTPQQRAAWMQRPGWAGRPGWGRGRGPGLGPCGGWGRGWGRGWGPGWGRGYGRGTGGGWGRGGW